MLQHYGIRHVSEESIYTSVSLPFLRIRIAYRFAEQTRALTLYWLLASSACDVMASLALFSPRDSKWKTFETSEDVGRYLLSTGVLNALSGLVILLKVA